MSLGLLAMLMGRQTLVQPPRLAGSSLRVPGLAGGGAGGAAEEGLGWQETQDLPGGGLSDASGSGIWHSPSEVGGCRAWGGSQTGKPWQAGGALAGLRPREGETRLAWTSWPSATTRLRHWETESNCRAGMRIQASPTPPSCKQWPNYVKHSPLE